jgi:hypothetical protein
MSSYKIFLNTLVYNVLNVIRFEKFIVAIFLCSYFLKLSNGIKRLLHGIDSVRTSHIG